jgi:dTDP-glucose pyrophosphorylase
MTKINKLKISIDATIKEALQIIDNGAVKFAMVVDSNDCLLGTVTDGDIRRAILDGKTLSDSIETIYFKNPVTVNINTTREEIINLCTVKKIYQIPVVDDENKVISIQILDEILKPKSYKNKVVLMVGGLGTRLRPLTNTVPKPMLPVGGKPILQIIVENFVNYGFINIIICVGYKSSVIQNYFGDGSKFGAKIEYVLEDKRMGTAGALSLLNSNQKPQEPFFVMNGDLLTNVNFESMLEFHLLQNSKATMGVRKYDFEVPYGVVTLDKGTILSIDEKPIREFFVSAGIYIFESSCLDLIPENEFYDMPTLFEKLIEDKEKTVPFPIREYWLDIGRIDEYEKANQEFYNLGKD